MRSIRASGLTKRYDVSRGVFDLDFQVNAGENLGIAGLNGAGKSTTLRLAAGLIEPTAGRIEVAPTVGYLPGELGDLDPEWSPRRYVRFFAAIQGRDEGATRTRLEELFAQLSLREVSRRPLGRLSSGERRKTEIARTLVTDPPVLLLDEPTRELDIPSRTTAWRLFRDHRERGGCGILASHDVTEILEVSTQVLILRRGRIVWRGPTTEIRALDDPHQFFEAHLTGKRDGRADFEIVTSLSGDRAPARY